MNNLKEYRLSDLYDISSGISSTKQQAGHGAPFLSFKTVFNNVIVPDVLPDKMDTTKAEQNTFSIKKGDVFVTRTSETSDELAMSCVALKDYPEATFSGFLKRLRPKEEGVVYDKYIAFYLRSSFFRQVIINNTIMTLRASFNEDMFSFLKVYLPPYDEQVKVGDLLYSIEKGIQNNTKICDSLQLQCQVLYDYWFIQFDFPDKFDKPYKSSGGEMIWNDELKRHIPAGWKVGTLHDISKVIWGQCPEGKDILDKSTSQKDVIDYCSGAGDMRNGFIVDCQAKTYVDTSRRMAHKDAVLLSVAGSIGALCVTDHDISLGRAAVAFEADNSEHNMFIFNVLTMLSNQVQKLATGSIQKVINNDHIDSMKFAYNEDVLNLYGNYTSLLYASLLNITEKNQRLVSLRNYILPILMNGQISIS